MISSTRLILSYTVQLVIPNIWTKFQNSSSVVPENPCDRNLMCEKLERMKKCTNKGNDKQEESVALLHDPISHTKILHKISITLSIGQKFKWREREMDKQQEWLNRKRLVLFYTVQLVIPNICTKYKNPSCHGSLENCERNVMCEKLEWKKKWTNIGNDKQEVADTLSCATTLYSTFVLNFKNTYCRNF